MLYARDRAGRLVQASKASSWGYKCPTCGAEVMLRSGQIRADHFAHMPGQGKPECEEFHPSDDLRHSWHTPVEPARPAVDPLRLSIELEPESGSRRAPRKWRLCVTVPKSHDDHGTVCIDCGETSPVRIALTKLALGPQSYSAAVNAADFGASWVSPEVRPDFRAAVERRVPGLNTTKANVFDTSRSKLKPASKVLCWGESFYFVWRADKPLKFPAILAVHDLAQNQGWACSLVSLPDAAVPDVATWLEKICDVRIDRAKREWALVYPPVLAINDDGDAQVFAVSSLLLAIKPADDEQHLSATLTCMTGQDTSSASVTGKDCHLLEIQVSGRRAPGLTCLSWGRSPLTALVTTPIADIAAELGIILNFDLAGEKRSAALHRESCRALLAEVRASKGRLRGLRGHPVLRGQLRRRRAGQLAWETEDLTFSNGDSRPAMASVSMDIGRVEYVNAILQDLSFDVDFDFGPFGSYYAVAAPPSKARTTVNIGRELRERVEWLCKTSGALVSAQRRTLSQLNDEELLNFFAKLAVPPSLIAHHRAIERELRYRTVRERLS